MKKIITLLLLVITSFVSFSQTCPIVTTTTGSVSCTAPCTNITANATPIYATSTYLVSSTTYSPFSFTTGTNVSTTSDDVFTTSIGLPFCFEFFGNTYNNVYIGSNGNISFNSTVSGGFDPWTIAGSIPSTTSPTAHRNCIMGVWCDMYPPGGGTIKYNTYGSYPCRVFVVSYYNIPLFGSCSGTKDTTQIAIYETSNIIDVYICSHNIPLCTSWNSGRAVTGIENSAGTLAYTATGQNGVAFSANHQGWRFSPNGTPYIWTYTWTGSSGIIGVGSSQNVCPTSTTTYNVVASATTACGVVNLPPATATVTSIVTVVSLGGDSVLCQGESSLLTSSLGGGSWISSNPSVATVNSSGVVSGVSPGVTTVTYTIAAGCQGTKIVAVNPIYNNTINRDICRGDTVNFAGINYTTSGSYTHTFNTINDCDSVVTLNLTLHEIPSAAFYVKPYNCVNDTIIVALTNTSNSSLVYNWNFNGANVIYSTLPGGPYGISYTTPGIHIITLNVSDAYCSSNVRDTIQVGNYPDATIIPITSTDVCAGDTIIFQARDLNPSYLYTWTPTQWIDNPNVSTIKCVPSFVGYVTLQIMTPFGCRDIDSIYINTKPCCGLEMPSAFTPNKDGKNDVFRLIGNRYFKLHTFIIVNRYGQVIFETANPKDEWDGTFNGVVQDMDVYFYYVDYECEGKEQYLKGNITLIR